MKAFLITIIAVTGLLLAGGYSWGGILPTYFYQSTLLLFASTTALFYYLLKIKEIRPDFFVQFYLISIALKLVAYGTYLGVIVWHDVENAAINIVFFLVTYVFYTTLEVSFLWRKISR